MDIKPAETALRRAHKAFRHAARQLEAAPSETARKRHARRMVNAQRRMGDARYLLEALTLERED